MKLSDHRVGATICVADMDRAREFYEGKLELEADQDMGQAVVYGAGEGTQLLVYASPEHAGKATATVATWGVEDLEALVDELASRGVEFASYGEPTPTNEKGIFKGEVGPTLAWMRDPDGNVIALTA
jgi:catechol 2,3-dioxygenase-like lactoylglutathione lyase family enzyme